VQAYPNPVSEVLNLAYTLPRPAPVSLRVLDATGRVLKTLRYGRQAPGRYQLALRPDELGLRAAGLYTLLLEVDGLALRHQLVRE
jgi:hypothetical protein